MDRVGTSSPPVFIGLYILASKTCHVSGTLETIFLLQVVH